MHQWVDEQQISKRFLSWAEPLTAYMLEFIMKPQPTKK